MRMMDYIGFDAVVVGNHDWLNGPDVLIDAWKAAGPKMALLGANLDISAYPRQNEFKKIVLPFVIKEVKGVKVAFIGLSTYEFIYDKYFQPVKILSPFSIAKDLASRLKRKAADVVIVVSHNSTKQNAEVLEQAPDVDLVVGAHDHRKYITPVIVKRKGAADGWIVETGSWGRYLGKVDLEVTPRDPAQPMSRPNVRLKKASLIQVDSRVPEHPEALARIEDLERRIEQEMGPVFSNKVAHNEVEMSRHGQENLMGNMATDAYFQQARKYGVQPDFAIDQVNFIYGELHPGNLTTAEIYNSNPAIYDPRTRKTWTLKTVDIEGKTLRWLMNLLFASKNIAQSGIVSLSNMQVSYDPAFAIVGGDPATGPIPPRLESWLAPWMNGSPSSAGEAQAVVKDIKIAGVKLDPNKRYRMAAGGGIIESIQYINSLLPGTVPMGSLKDTGVESWKLMEEHLASMGTVTIDRIPVGNRVQTLQADLGIIRDHITWQPLGKTARGALRARIRARISNHGGTDYRGGVSVQVLGHANGLDESVERRSVPLADPGTLPAIQAGQHTILEWEIVVPGERDIYPITLQIETVPGEVNLSNNAATYYFVYSGT
jgi:2',3'-cyclic-nucleotide 2'-phosphodiesterase (5'-nucleotidase family)